MLATVGRYEIIEDLKEEARRAENLEPVAPGEFFINIQKIVLNCLCRNY